MNEEAFSPVRGYQAKADPTKASDHSRSEATVGFPPDKISPLLSQNVRECHRLLLFGRYTLPLFRRDIIFG